MGYRPVNKYIINVHNLNSYFCSTIQVKHLITEIWQSEYQPFVTLENFPGLSLSVYVCVFTVCGQSLALFPYFSVLVTEKRWEKYLQRYPAWSRVIRLKYSEAAWQYLACPWFLEFHNKMFGNVESHWNHASEPGWMIQTSYFHRPSTLKEKKKNFTF